MSVLIMIKIAFKNDKHAFISHNLLIHLSNIMLVASLLQVLVLRLPRHFQSASVASYGIILAH